MLVQPSRAVSFLLILLLCAVATYSAANGELRYTVLSEKSFDEVLEDLKFAITEQNFRITSLNSIGQAISKREGKPFPRVTVIHFCNVEFAREILEIDANYALNMPCRVAIHEQSRRITIQTYFLPDNDPQLTNIGKKINIILKSIVDYAAWD